MLDWIKYNLSEFVLFIFCFWILSLFSVLVYALVTTPIDCSKVTANTNAFLGGAAVGVLTSHPYVSAYQPVKGK